MTFVIRNNKGSDRFLAGIGFDKDDSTYRNSTHHSTDFFDYFF